MCALKSPMSQVMLNTSVMAITDKSDPLTNFWLGGGGGGGKGATDLPAPPLKQ